MNQLIIKPIISWFIRTNDRFTKLNQFPTLLCTSVILLEVLQASALFFFRLTSGPREADIEAGVDRTIRESEEDARAP